MPSVRHSWLAGALRVGWSLLAIPACVVGCGGGGSGGSDSPDASGGTIGAGGRSGAGNGGQTPGEAGADQTPGGDVGDSGATGNLGGGAGVSGVAGLNGDAGAGGYSGSTGGGDNGGAIGIGGSYDGAPSCVGSTITCGPTAQSCCSSLVVPGGQFMRSYDGVSSGYQNANAPASVSGFRLDRYEVTVGRFRQFVSAVVGSWRPDAGSGIREDLNLGLGRVNVGPAAGYETGWDSSWESNLGNTAAVWDANLACSTESSTWTASAGQNEALPITCVDWYEAFAFCIWDQGTLPTEAEWNEAASGGSEQRVFPWSSPATSLLIDCAHANYRGAAGQGYCTRPGAVSGVGAESPIGDGLWGHSDLAGNVFEWVLDSYAAYSPSCPDCVYLDNAAERVIRGGGYDNDSSFLLSSKRTKNRPEARAGNAGLRCARGM